MKITTEKIRETLRRNYTTISKRGDPQTWIFWEELKNGVGFSKSVMGFIDFFVMNVYPSKQFKRIAYEIKVSRSDWLSELKKPNKRRFAFNISNEFYFIAPKGIIKIEELPKGCGLKEVGCCPNGYLWCDTTVPAIWRETLPPNWAFVASLCRKLFLKNLEKE